MRTLDASFFQNGKAGLKPQAFSTQEIERDSVAYVASLTANERDLCEVQWQMYRKQNSDSAVGLRAFIVTFCLCDAENVRMFDSGSSDKRLTTEFINAMDAIAKMPSRLISRAFNAASELNGFTESDVEDLEKNSEATANGCGNGAMPQQPVSAVASG